MTRAALLLAAALLACLLTGLPWHDPAETLLILRDLRLPRAALGLLAGMALGAAGLLLQAITRNPLAEPGLLGINAGAACLMVAGTALFGLTSVAQAVWLGLLGALLAMLAVLALGRLAPLRLTLAGIALAAVLGGVAQGLLLLDPATFETLRGWHAGSLAGRAQAILPLAGPPMLLGLLLAALAARPLDALARGEELGAGLGARPGRLRLMVLAAVTLLAGGATAAIGPVGFLGLMAPHLARRWAGPGLGGALRLTLLVAPALLLAADAAGRLVLPVGELPVGILAAFLGAPALILLARRRRA